MTMTQDSGRDIQPNMIQIDLVKSLRPAVRAWRTIAGVTVLAAAAGIGLSFLVTPMYKAANVFLPPQQQGGSNSALASLGALSSIVGAGANVRNSPDQYIALMRSVTVSDRIIKKFGLMAEWDTKYMVDARRKLALLVDMTASKKDSLITVEVTDSDPQRAATIANQYVDELRILTNGLAVTEAQQRRAFFEHLMEQTRDKLATAQIALEGSGYSAGALNVEPRSAAEGYAQLRAELTAAEVKLQVLRNQRADTAPEVSSQIETVNALRAQIAKIEAQDQVHPKSGDYIARYREFKYQETLFDLFARQYESARVDESREGALIQVIDPATKAERKASPKRMTWGLVAALLGLLGSSAFFVFRRSRSPE